MNYRITIAGLLPALLLAGCAMVSDRDRALNTKENLAAAAEANTQLGIEYLRQGNYEQSLQKLEKALSLDPDMPAAHDAIAVLYERVGEPEKAEQHYKKSLRLNSDNARGHNNYGQFLCSQGRYAEADKQFRAAADNPFYEAVPVALTNAGMCASLIPDTDKAEQYFRKALDLDPEFAPALLQMSSLKYSQDNYLSARAYMQRYQEAASHSPESLWLAIRTEYALHDRAAWNKYAFMLRNMFPDSEQAALLQEWENERRPGN
jgi:type IV pilus assembly protein PilF